MTLRRRASAVGAALLLTAGCGSDSDREPSIVVGDSAPVFGLPSAAGGEVALSDFSGRPVLLYFSMGPG